jgi:hypothetical protein
MDSLALGESVASNEIKNPCSESELILLSHSANWVRLNVTVLLLITHAILDHPLRFLSDRALIVPAILFQRLSLS